MRVIPSVSVRALRSARLQLDVECREREREVCARCKRHSLGLVRLRSVMRRHPFSCRTLLQTETRSPIAYAVGRARTRSRARELAFATVSEPSWSSSKPDRYHRGMLAKTSRSSLPRERTPENPRGNLRYCGVVDVSAGSVRKCESSSPSETASEVQLAKFNAAARCLSHEVSRFCIHARRDYSFYYINSFQSCHTERRFFMNDPEV